MRRGSAVSAAKAHRRPGRRRSIFCCANRLVKSATLPDPRDALPSADGLAGLAPDLAPGCDDRGLWQGPLARAPASGPIAWHSRARRFVAAPPTCIVRGDLRETEASIRTGRSSFDRDADFVLAAQRAPAGPLARSCRRACSSGFRRIVRRGLRPFASKCATSRARRSAAASASRSGGVFVLEGAFEIVAGRGAVRPRASRRAARRLEFRARRMRAGRRLAGRRTFPRRCRAKNIWLRSPRYMRDEKIGRWRNDDAADRRRRRAAPMAA